MVEPLHLLGPAITGHHGKGPKRQQRGLVNFGGTHKNGAGAAQQIEQTVPEISVVDRIMKLSVTKIIK